MTTRSGKRIRGFAENAVGDVVEIKLGRKTRGKRVRENSDENGTEKKHKHCPENNTTQDNTTTHEDKVIGNKRKTKVKSTKVKSNDLKQTEISHYTLNNITNSNNKKRKLTLNDKVDVSEIHLNACFDSKVPNNITNESDKTNESHNKGKNKKKQKSIRKSVPNVINYTLNINLDATYEKDDSNTTEKITTQEKETGKPQHFSKYKLDKDVSTNLNLTYDNKAISEKDDSNPTEKNLKQKKETRELQHFSKYVLDQDVSTNLNLTYNNKATSEKDDPKTTEKNLKQEEEIRELQCFSKHALDQDVSGNLNITYDNNATPEKDDFNPTEKKIMQERETRKLQRFSKYSLDQDVSANLNITYDNNATSEKDDANPTEKNLKQEKGTRKPQRFSKYVLDQDVSTNLNLTYDNTATSEKDDPKTMEKNLKQEKEIGESQRFSKHALEDVSGKLNITYDNNATPEKDDVNPTEKKIMQERETRKSQRFSKYSLDQDVSANLNITYDNNATSEKDYSNPREKNLTQEKETRKSQCISKYSLDQDVSANLNIAYDKNATSESQMVSQNNTTFDKSPIINTTFEMANKDSTFDKSQNDKRRGSSLISSDITDNSESSNVTSDNSKDVSRISITSDESMAENIVNTTPVLIESSMDESQINISSKDETTYKPNDSKTKDVTPPPRDELEYEGFSAEKSLKPPKFEGSYNVETKENTTPKGKDTFKESKGSSTPKCEETYTEFKTSKTPLKREGTYTELNPMITPSKVNQTSTENNHKTPVKLNAMLENEPTLLIREGTFTKDDSMLENVPTLLKREGTFTKDDSVEKSPTLNVNKTPLRRKSLPSPGRTPFVIIKSTSKDNGTPIQEKHSMFNITRSIEKSRRSSVDLPRTTRVMFCSPVDTPAVVGPKKGRVIKSNLKGSDKSFVFDDSVSERAVAGRKRSYTQSEAEAIGVKRKRLTERGAEAPRLSRPRTTSASAKLQAAGTPSKSGPTSAAAANKTNPERRVLRTKLPNFKALHQKHFAKMESLDECQERKAKRARQLLTPTAPVSVLDRVSPRETQPEQPFEQPQSRKTETPKKSILPEGYTKFGFKLKLDVNPFSSLPKAESKPVAMETRAKLRDSRVKTTETITAIPVKVPPKRQTLPSRKEVAQQTISRGTSFSAKRDAERKEHRTVIKGVRTNRRFDLHMQMRNMK